MDKIIENYYLPAILYYILLSSMYISVTEVFSLYL